MPYWVYMLFVGNKKHGSNRKIYTGYTKNLSIRLTQHLGVNSVKGARLTRNQPIELAYLESFNSRAKAMQRERQLKHEAPFNQKREKLKLINDFKKTSHEYLICINNMIEEYYSFLGRLIECFSRNEDIIKRSLNE